MKTEGATCTPVSKEQAADIMCYALSSWKITYHSTSNPEYEELDLKNPENGDVMEIHFLKNMLDHIVIYSDDDIVDYMVI